MKKQFYFFVLIFAPCFIQAQNVGVGTTTPTEKLEVKNPLRSTLKISSGGFADTTELILSNRNISNQGTDFSMKSIRESGLFFSSSSDLPGNNASNSLVISPNGNVGIGIIPVSKFHVNGASLLNGTATINGATTLAGTAVLNGTTTINAATTINATTSLNGFTRLEGLNLFEFGAGIAGKETNAGKIGYNAFGTNALAIVGAGTSTLNRKVYIIAEGGTTLDGPTQVLGNTNIIGGQLQLNGISGTAGQVLTSNGTSAPTWTNSSFGNIVRFAASYTDNLSLFPSSNNIFTSIYNYSPSDIAISTSIITINKSGLYHIEGYMTASASFSAAPSYLLTDCWLSLDGIDIYYASAEPLNRSSSTFFDYQVTTHFSQDIYLTAPAIILPRGSIGNVPSPLSRSVSGRITGYLISE